MSQHAPQAVRPHAAEVVPKEGVGPGGLSRRLLDQNLGVILLLPSALTFLVLLVFPLGYGIYTSFLQRHVLDPEGVWVGLANYAWLFGNAEFWQSLAISSL